MLKSAKAATSRGVTIDTCIERMAQTLVDYCTRVKEDDKVWIRSTTLGTPLVEAVYKACIIRGAHPEVILRTDNMENLFYQHAQDHQLEYTSPFTKYFVEHADVMMTILADFNLKRLTTVDPQKVVKRSKAEHIINATASKRAYEGALQWILTVYPTQAMAQEASMSFLEYQDFVYSACFADRSNPRAEWQKLSLTGRKIAYFLNKKTMLHIVGEDTDLRLKILGRRWINADGHRNFPSGEVFTSPIEDSAEGTIRFTYPGIHRGKEVAGIVLTFEKGNVVKASADKGDDLLQEMLNTDEGAKRIGEVALGTNYGITRFTKNILFDEKIGGTIHVALGRSILGTRGRNNSAIHWDLVKDMRAEGRIYADGELFYENGTFLI